MKSDLEACLNFSLRNRCRSIFFQEFFSYQYNVGHASTWSYMTPSCHLTCCPPVIAQKCSPSPLWHKRSKPMILSSRRLRLSNIKIHEPNRWSPKPETETQKPTDEIYNSRHWMHEFPHPLNLRRHILPSAARNYQPSLPRFPFPNYLPQ